MKNSIFISFIILLFSGLNLSAQERLGVEVRVNASFPTTDIGDASLNVGPGSEVIVDYQLVSNLGVFIGRGWNRFSADATATVGKMDYDETGYIFGVQYNRQLGEGPLGLYLRAGGIYNQVDINNEDGDSAFTTDNGLGCRIGVGLNINLGGGWQINPGVKYQALNSDYEMESNPFSANYNYFAVGVGVAKRF